MFNQGTMFSVLLALVAFQAKAIGALPVDGSAASSAPMVDYGGDVVVEESVGVFHWGTADINQAKTRTFYHTDNTNFTAIYTASPTPSTTYAEYTQAPVPHSAFVYTFDGGVTTFGAYTDPGWTEGAYIAEEDVTSVQVVSVNSAGVTVTGTIQIDDSFQVPTSLSSV